MNIIITIAGIMIMFIVTMLAGFMLNGILKWIRLRFLSPIAALVLLLNMTYMTREWYSLLLLGIVILSAWTVIRSLYMKAIARKIVYAEEQLDNVWASLYAIYALYAALQRSFPYHWVENKLDLSPNAAVITLVCTALSFLLLLSSLSAIFGPYKQLKGRLKKQACIDEASLKSIVRITDPKRREEALGYVDALAERLVSRQKIMRLVDGGKRFLIKKGSRMANDEPVRRGSGTDRSPESPEPGAQASLSAAAGTDHSSADTDRSVLNKGSSPLNRLDARAADEEPLSVPESCHDASETHGTASGPGIDQSFRILRQNFSKHPIAETTYEDRLHYMTVLFYAIEDLKRKHSIADELLSQYAVMLGIRQEDAEPIRSIPTRSSPELRSAFQAVKKIRWRKRKGWLYSRYSYKYAAFGEFLYTRQRLTGEKAEEEITRLYGQSLGISADERKLTMEYCAFLLEGKLKAAQLLLHSQMPGKWREGLSFLYEREAGNRAMDDRSRFGTAVVATMSAGKSTFMNALAAKDLLPSKNQACTAKITALVHNAQFRQTIGYSRMAAGGYLYSGAANAAVTARWNGIPEDNEVYLEGSLAGAYCAESAFAFYDTPGTNYSMDSGHNEITYRFLEERPMNLIVYLINATQISTDDNRVLLHKVTAVMEKAERPPNILFLLNKADEFDLEGDDDLDASIGSVIHDLKEAGVEEPDVIPISSYGAKLFRMALAGRELSKKEMKDMGALYRLFIEDGVDFTQFARIPRINQPDDPHSYSAVHPCPDVLTVGGNQYRGSEMLQALQRTGMPAVEAYINHLAHIQGGNRSNG
ncbi:dynamin family protein [Paenibacillus spongiae]|uniref:Dynamin family protein n=1 Tax=Paenibacillus spongiae TaxID=2909671 RepID=A0ABY5SDD0_9BACL|nr:dynamin family protein [Paenibacillus spongiae]UVI31961.1 dynamin family protein [Paenibacillus spongiae]